jgi:hypothetical protein
VEIQYQDALDQEAARQRLREHLDSMKRQSSEAGVAMVERVANAAEALIAMHPPSEDKEREVMETVFRSLDLMTLLVHDAGRRRQGYPPAALHEAVHVLLEQVDRIKVQIH